MAVPIIAISLVIVLAIIVAILNKKSIDRHNHNASSITELGSKLNKRCDTIDHSMDFKSRDTKFALDSLRSDTQKSESDIRGKIDVLKEEMEISISTAIKQASENADDAYLKAAQHTDTKVDGVIQYIDEVHDDLVKRFEERVETLASVIDSLNRENAELRKELEDQKKKLNFYANIEEAAENLTVKEDSQDRTRTLEAVKKTILDDKTTSNTSKKNKEKSSADIRTAAQNGSQSSHSETVEHGEPQDEKSLDPEQEFARKYMENSMENVFITGKAGTGKSFLLDIFRLTTSKKNIVLAPTGIAALNVKGATLHSTFGYYNLVKLNVNNITADTIRLKSEKRNVLERVKTIIIDEISMVRADTFDKIDKILKVISGSDQPFGGKQMLIFGDLFQLPPVTKHEEHEYLHDKYGGIFFFHSSAYKAGNFKFIELTQNHRQKGDEAFFEILNRIREGKTTDADIELLNTRYTSDESVYDRYTALFPTKAEAERVNRTRISEIESKEFLYKAKTILDISPNKNKSLENIFPIIDELRLRLGASVMMVANDPDGRWVNGTVGIVKEISQDRIIVSFGRKRNYEIQPLEFDEQEISYDGKDITYETIFSVLQYPIVPAYAITIHKSQGQTYENVLCDIERCFASGQAYVALSRCASLNGLHLKSLITPASIKVDHEVLDFYRSQQKNDLLQ